MNMRHGYLIYFCDSFEGIIFFQRILAIVYCSHSQKRIARGN